MLAPVPELGGPDSNKALENKTELRHRRRLVQSFQVTESGDDHD